MTHEPASTPHTNDCIKSDHRMFFTFDPEKSTFLSGYLGINVTTITGTLLVRFTQAIKARKINLYFIGREKVEWVNLRKIKKEKIILKQHEILWKSNNPIGYELITDLTLPFEFQVPSNAIESFNSNFGHVQYTLKAVINKKQIKKKNWIEVKVPIWRWTRPSIEELKPLIIKSKSSQHRRHQIEWEAILPKTFFDINSKFKIKLRMIVQDPDLRIKKISTFLKGIVKYFNNNNDDDDDDDVGGGGSSSSDNVDDDDDDDDDNDDGKKILPFEKVQYLYKGEIINGKDVVMTPNGLDTLFEANILINIPNDVIPTCKTDYMKIINEIQIKVMFERSNTYVLITREILIGRNYETRVED